MAKWKLLSSSPGILSPAELMTFCGQLYLLINAGIAINEGIGILSRDVESPKGRGILDGLRKRMDQGRSFHDALAAVGCFPKYMVDMVKIGEVTGNLDKTLHSLQKYYDGELSFRHALRRMAVYPLVISGMMLMVIAVLILKVLPIFAEVFTGLGMEMNPFSLRLIKLGQDAAAAAPLVCAALFLAVISVLVFRSTAAGRRFFRRLGATFFLTGNLCQKIAFGRFASAMSLTLSSGLDASRSLDIVYALVDNEPVRKRIDLCRQYLAEYLGFSDALVKSGLFSGIHARMVDIGYKTGSLDQVMSSISARYDEEIDQQLGAVLSVLEPLLTAILSVVTGTILLSVMFPLMNAASAML